MVFPIYQVVFFIFAAILLAAAVMVIASRNPVHAILWLVLAFFASAALWLMLQAEFLALVLIFVYVGAVMTLFLFVVMMLNIDLSKTKEKFMRFLPLGILIMLVFIGMMVMVVSPKHLGVIDNAKLASAAAGYSNTQAMGTLMYTQYILPFEIAGALLLVAIVAAITLAFQGRKKNTKQQNMAAQQMARKQDRLRIVKMKAEKS